jgi:hypothetical protein
VLDEPANQAENILLIFGVLGISVDLVWLQVASGFVLNYTIPRQVQVLQFPILRYGFQQLEHVLRYDGVPADV